MVIGLGLGLVLAPVQNAATAGVDTDDAGVASAMINTVQWVDGSIGTALLSSFAASAAAGYVADHAASAETVALATLHSCHVVFWWSAAFFAVCAVASALLFCSGPLEIDPDAIPAMAH